jgi:hypothetical protein
MVDVSGISNIAFQWASSAIVWVIIIGIMLMGSYGALVIRRNKKFSIPCAEQIELGDGKVGLNTTFKPFLRNKPFKAGWFGKQRIFFGLWDYGNDRECITNDGRKVQQASTSDFHDLNGQRGFILARKKDDPKILIPIKRIYLDERSQNSMNAIAPADFRDAAVEIFEQNTRESQQTWEKVVQYIALGVIAIILFITILMIIQYSKWSITEAKDLVIQVSKQTYQNAGVIGNSGAP